MPSSKVQWQFILKKLFHNDWKRRIKMGWNFMLKNDSFDAQKSEVEMWNIPFGEKLFVGCLLSFSDVDVMAAKGEISCAMYTKPTLTPDEIQLKKEMRKITNRESARRSRIRKQLQLEQLVISVEALTHENNLLRDELKRLSSKRNKLIFENVLLKEELSKYLGAERVEEVDFYLQSPADEDYN